MQTRSYDKISVYPSVCLSVCQTRALWLNGRKICLHFYTLGKIIYPSFLRKKNGLWGVVGATPFTWHFGSTGPRLSEIAHFEPIIARSASAVRHSEKSSINTPLRALQLYEPLIRLSPYVASKSPKGGSKTQNGHFPSKIALLLKKVCYKVSLCENCQYQSISINQSINQSMWWRTQAPLSLYVRIFIKNCISL